MLRSVFDARGIADAMEGGGLIRSVVGTVMQIVAVLGAVAVLYAWAREWERIDGLEAGPGVVFTVWQLAVVYALTLVVQIVLLRARAVKDLEDSHFVVTPILAVVIRLQGEIMFIVAGVFSVPLTLMSLWGSRELRDLADVLPLVSSGRDDLYSCIMTFLSCWVVGFLSLLVARAIAELLTAVFMIAHDVGAIRETTASYGSRNERSS